MTATILHNVFSVAIRNGGEFGTFHIRQGKDKTTHWCELSIYSSFGNVGYFWSSMGVPAHQFLADISCDYLMGKLYGTNSTEFDPERTIIELKRILLREVRAGQHDKYEKPSGRDLYDALDELKAYSTEREFGEAYWEQWNSETDNHDLVNWLHPTDIPWCRTINPQAKGLWEKLWPEFIQALKDQAT